MCKCHPACIGTAGEVLRGAACARVPPQSLTEDAGGPEVEVNGRKRPRVRDSFFLWFEEGVGRGEASLADDPVADIIKEHVWPNPLALYQAASEARALHTPPPLPSPLPACGMHSSMLSAPPHRYIWRLLLSCCGRWRSEWLCTGPCRT